MSPPKGSDTAEALSTACHRPTAYHPAEQDRITENDLLEHCAPEQVILWVYAPVHDGLEHDALQEVCAELASANAGRTFCQVRYRTGLAGRSRLLR